MYGFTQIVIVLTIASVFCMVLGSSEISYKDELVKEPHQIITNGRCCIAGGALVVWQVTHDQCFTFSTDFNNYCCKEGNCCNYMTFVFKQQGDFGQNFAYTFENPRLINMVIVVPLLLVIILAPGLVLALLFCICCRCKCVHTFHNYYKHY